jgi:transposase-like protein
MPMLSHLHQLFNADTCQAYLHMLRWKGRPLQCPRCHSYELGPWGNDYYRPGLKRYWCHGCRRTFNDLTHTLLAQSKRSLVHRILATFPFCLACSSHRIAREVGIHIREHQNAGGDSSAAGGGAPGGLTPGVLVLSPWPLSLCWSGHGSDREAGAWSRNPVMVCRRPSAATTPKSVPLTSVAPPSAARAQEKRTRS